MIGKPCSTCRQPGDLPYVRYCRRCKNKYAREHRPKYIELSDEQKDKANWPQRFGTAVQAQTQKGRRAVDMRLVSQRIQTGRQETARRIWA
jgi:hypothetical protein